MSTSRTCGDLHPPHAHIDGQPALQGLRGWAKARSPRRFIATGVIPGRRSEVEANPESSNHRPGLLDSGFSTLGLRPISRPGMTDTSVRVRTLTSSQGGGEWFKLTHARSLVRIVLRGDSGAHADARGGGFEEARDRPPGRCRPRL